MTMNLLEKLMALLDGELVPSEGAAVVREAAVADDLVPMLEVCAATGRNLVSKPYAFIASEPAPAPLVDMIMRAPTAAPAVERVGQPSHSRTLLSRLKKRYQVPGWTLAASHAMAAVFVAAALAWPLLPTLGHGRQVETGLNAALEKTEGGKDFALASLRPVRTFRNNEGAWCRQFEVRYGTRQISYALACRNDAGNWPVLAATPPGPVVFSPSGDGEQANPRKLIDDRADAMRNGDAVFGAEESELVKNGWPSLRG